MPSPNTIPPTVPASAARAESRAETPIRATPVAEPVATPPLCLGAVFAGAVAALAVHLLATLFGIGLGVQIIDPLRDAEPAQNFSVGVGIAWSVSALIALWIGGWVAGRVAPEPTRGLGGLHGFLVWSLATVVVLFALTGGASMLVGGVARLTGGAVKQTAQAVAPAAESGGDLLARFAGPNTGLIQSFARELSPASAPSGGQAPAPDARAMREISWALLRFFSQDPAERSGDARAALVRAIDEHTPLDQAEASRRVDRMIASYDEVQRDVKEMTNRAETKAREAAEAASDYVTHAAVWTFVAFLVGAIAATWGGSVGARSRQNHDPLPARVA